MRFWDTSAVVPLLFVEPASTRLFELLRTDGDAVVWWGTPVECGSAIARRERDAKLPSTAANLAFDQLRVLQLSWTEVTPSTQVRDIALRLLRTHRLRAADALQLAAAIVASEGQPAIGFVCLDERLAAAARREGFTVSP